VTTEEVLRRGVELGLDAVGVTPAEAYADTERHIVERRARGLFAGMKFTTAQPEVSCHPEALIEGSRTVISAALCYWEPEPDLPAGHGRLARYTWADRYAELREKLDVLGAELGGEYRVLVDANQHVDREAAARSGVGFYGKNTMLITRRHGSWVVLGTLVTTVALDATAPLDVDCGDCRLCIDACPTDALHVAGVLDSTRCLSWSTQAPEPIPVEHRALLEAQVYGCDICQDVCPWNRGIEKRRSHLPKQDSGHVDLVDWLQRDERSLADEFDRLYVPANDARWLRRNALVTLGNVGRPQHLDVLERYAAGEDELLAEHARWALVRVQAKASTSTPA
jgi:epoxyqueuosine reductase